MKKGSKEKPALTSSHPRTPDRGAGSAAGLYARRCDAGIAALFQGAATQQTGSPRPNPLTGGVSGWELTNKRRNELCRKDVAKVTVFVGAGTCGLGAGAKETLSVVRSHLSANGVDADIIETGCIGLCSAEPLMDIQIPGKRRLSFQHVTHEVAPTILDAVLKGEIPKQHILCQFESEGREPWQNIPMMNEHPFFAPQTRFVLANCGLIDPRSIEEYIARGGYEALMETLQKTTPEELCDEVEQSGLRGRGGGGFPTGKKWRLTLQAPSHQKYMICNADEGDPGAFMDRAVIEGDPHRLVEGLALAAYAIGASKAYVYIRAEYPLAIAHLEEAIEQAHDYGLLGDDIQSSGFNLNIIVKKGAGAFVCGEETALIHSIEGKRGMPRPRPPYPATSGLFGKPTAINNVETLANVPTIVKKGAEWFASTGTEYSKGTKVFALSGKVARTGLLEVAMGTSVRDIVFDIGGGTPGGKDFKAVQIGGPSGGCIPSQHLDIRVDYESLKEVGAMMGSGGLVVMDEDNCMVDVATFFMDFIGRESCGKCIPCREGTKRMLEILKAISRGRRNEEGVQALERFRGIVYLEQLARVIRDTSLCGLGQSAPNPVLSTLRWFKDEYEAHIYERHCPAGVCTELLEYRIDADICTGCMVCIKKCPVDAIMGAKKSPHYIIPDKCIGCGSCLDACRFNAVIAE